MNVCMISWWGCSGNAGSEYPALLLAGSNIQRLFRKTLQAHKVLAITLEVGLLSTHPIPCVSFVFALAESAIFINTT